MSEMSRKARREMRAKAHRLVQEHNGKVDASDYGGEEILGADVKTGMRPVSRRAYKSGGKVIGPDAVKHAGKMPRTGNKRLTANDYVNRNAKDANDEREGLKHIGGLKRGGRANGGNAGDTVPQTRMHFSPGVESRITKAAGLKKGGRAKKSVGGTLAAAGLGGLSGLGLSQLIGGKDKDDGPNKQRGGSVSDGTLEGTRPTGGRRAKKDGGGNWIKGAIKHPGALHKELGVPAGKKIPAKKLEKAEHSDNPKLAKRAQLAETLGRMHRKDGGRTGKGKMNVNIVIATGKDQQPMPPQGMMPPGGPPRGVPVAVPGAPGGAPPPMPAAPPPMMPMSAGAPPPMPMPMPRKSGGRTMQDAAAALAAADQQAAILDAQNNRNQALEQMGLQTGQAGQAGPSALPRRRGGRTGYFGLDAGAGSGLGRLQKADRA